VELQLPQLRHIRLPPQRIAFFSFAGKADRQPWFELINQLLRQLGDTGLPAGGNIEYPGCFSFCHTAYCPGHISGMNKVAGFFAGAVHFNLRLSAADFLAQFIHYLPLQSFAPRLVALVSGGAAP